MRVEKVSVIYYLAREVLLHSSESFSALMLNCVLTRCLRLITSWYSVYFLHVWLRLDTVSTFCTFDYILIHCLLSVRLITSWYCILSARLITTWQLCCLIYWMFDNVLISWCLIYRTFDYILIIILSTLVNVRLHLGRSVNFTVRLIGSWYRATECVITPWHVV